MHFLTLIWLLSFHSNFPAVLQHPYPHCLNLEIPLTALWEAEVDKDDVPQMAKEEDWCRDSPLCTPHSCSSKTRALYSGLLLQRSTTHQLFALPSGVRTGE